MKKILFFTILVMFSHYSFSQDYENALIDEGVSPDYYNSNEKNISIPLYTVKTGGLSSPIYLSYNLNGTKINDLPSSLGFNWTLHAGGTIDKKINHLDDEYENGWFFKIQRTINTGVSHYNNPYKNDDICPDFFLMSMSSGDFLNFTFDADLHPFIINQNGSFLKNGNSIYVDFNKLSNSFNQNYFSEQDYHSDYDADITINNSKGVKYTFRKGIKRIKSWELFKRSAFVHSESPTTLPSFTNYYIHRISNSFNTKHIDFEHKYITNINRLTANSRADRMQVNNDLHTPPDAYEHTTTNFMVDLSVEDKSRKEISKITTDKEIILFTYKDATYWNGYQPHRTPSHPYPLNKIVTQKINLLDEIKIYDFNNNYITGYKFFYKEQTADQSEYEGDLKLWKIIKYAKNHKDFTLYKEFNYYPQPNRPSAASENRDVLGFANSAQNDVNSCSMTVIDDYCSVDDRLPNESAMIRGMLKIMTVSDGGSTEYHYKENSYGEMYYGGLLVDYIKKFDENVNLIKNTEIIYEQPEGFGLSVYENFQEIQDEQDIPANIYERGFWDISLQGFLPWESFFTKRELRYSNYPQYSNYQVSSSPFALMKNISETESLLSDLQIQDFPQITNGIFYKKITKKNYNVVTNQVDNGYSISYYSPEISGFILKGRLQKQEFYNNSEIKIKQKTYNYDNRVQGHIDGYKYDNVHIGSYSYRIDQYQILSVKNILKNVETSNFTNTGVLISNSKKEYTYLNENTTNVDYNKIKSVKYFFNDNEYKRNNNKYFSEYSNTSQDYRYINDYINPIIETSTWKKENNNWYLSSAFIKEYMVDNQQFRDEMKIKNSRKIFGNKATGLKYNMSNYIESYYDYDQLISLNNSMIEYGYDTNNRLLLSEKNTETNTTVLYQRSDEYNGLYIDAVLTTTEDNVTFLKKSFENKNESNVISFDKAFSGNYVFNGNSISLGNYPVNYTISYWAYENNNWKYHSSVHTGGNVTITKPANALYIDEIRVQPKNATMQTFTFNPLIGKTSSLNDRGEGERIEYDVFNRPLFIFDKNHKVLKEYRYNTKQN